MHTIASKCVVCESRVVRYDWKHNPHTQEKYKDYLVMKEAQLLGKPTYFCQDCLDRSYKHLIASIKEPLYNCD